MQKSLLSSGLILMLVLVFLPCQSMVTAGNFDWTSVPIEETNATETADNDDSNAEAPKKKGNRFVRVVSAPFRALGRLFGGGSKKNNDQQTARRSSDKDVPKFEGTTVTRIKDATTAVVTTPANSATTSPSSTAEFEKYLSKARELLNAGDANAAINELTTATAINQRSAEANKLLGVAYESKGWRDSAMRSFEMAVELDENNSEHLNNLGFLLYKSGEYERATKFLKRAAKIAKNNPRIWNNLGLAQCSRGKFDDAFESFARAVGEFNGHLNVAAQLQQHGQAKEAIKHLQKAQAMNPNSTDVLNKLVSLYEMTGRPTDAEAARRSLIALKTFADANK
jgi:Flp pilus assembly protein TadD